jgi:intraflagellar transport protein 46
LLQLLLACSYSARVVSILSVNRRCLQLPRPDGQEDRCGLSALDEPGPVQSDPTVLDLQLRTLSKRAPGSEAVLVRSIEHADKNPREVQRWIQSVAEVHRSRPPPTVPYARPMPDIERLMQEWPPQLEELLKTNALPGADLDLSVEEYARIVCALLDIPVYPSATSAAGSLVQSLHVLFTLYGEFKANAHFAALAAGGGAATAGGATAGGAPGASMGGL